MQFGWCTLKCYFSHETGVGDTWTSFSYDGGRVRKWNVLNSKYGDVRTKKNPIGFVFLSKSLFFYLVLVIWRCYILSNRLWWRNNIIQTKWYWFRYCFRKYSRWSRYRLFSCNIFITKWTCKSQFWFDTISTSDRRLFASWW